MLKLAKPHRNRAGSAFLLGQIAFSQGLPCRWIKDRRLMRFIVVDCAGSAEALWNLPFAWEAGWHAARALHRRLKKELRRAAARGL
ncbi:hypothetical protein L598_002700000480 [Mesorhizobium sp. J18]|uniref:hypothetical protein n=1 Tax=Mesorhizobium sp. J18 TaxID=935263 RepID=UPI00119AC32C|nr:hypothetical protein [Mesorhizobium sp. J18]TWG96318.1 hypothetical protein L598_002700000480 [Mesorhizobium sp. J18]